jgi:hypothetical protein
MGIYLPMALTLLIPIGAVLGHLYNRWAARSGNYEVKERLGVLMATGLIVGESLFGVAFAGAVAATDDDTPLSLFPEGFEPSALISIAVFVAAVLFLYQSTRRSAAALPAVAGEPGIGQEANYR